MKKLLRLPATAGSFQIFSTGRLSAAAELVDQRTIAEQYGDLAQPKNCFTKEQDVGLIGYGVNVSNWDQLQNTNEMSFAHRVTAFKYCYPPDSIDNDTSTLF